MRGRALLVVPLLALAACDSGSRKLAGDYRLRQGFMRSAAQKIDTVYSLWNTARPENEAGWSGNVVRIGWSGRAIVVLRAAPPTSYGHPAGWTVIDVGSRKESPVLTDAQFQQHRDSAQLTTYRADSAWTRLHR